MSQDMDLHTTAEDGTRSAEALITQDFVRDPHATYDWMREEGPVKLRQASGSVLWMLTRYEDARAALAEPKLHKDPRRFPNPAGGTGMGPEEPGMELLSRHMLNSDPPDHTRLRKLTTKAFTARPTEMFRPRIEELAAGLLDGFEAGQRMDVVNDYAMPLSTRVICELIGIPAADGEIFRDWYTTMTGVHPPEQVTEARQSLIRYLGDLIADKRARPADDLISNLLQARDADDLLSETEVMSMVFLLLGAGHETAISFIGTAMLSLLSEPDQLALLQKDLTLLPGAIEELLRFESPINVATFRYAAEPVEIGGVTIPAGDSVFVSIGALNRDPSKFSEPDRLEITRPATGHLAFGHGLHHCLGAPLARVEGAVAIGQLITRFPDLAPAVGREDLQWRFSLMLRCLESLPVVL
ncbi:cytochrome P450 [Streptomyces fimicarius]|uniref:cytochrome P450 family protein n=1 Tax=Streptomyces TaxID=1883 RepID=UPI00067A75A9|nr:MULTISPECIES: cytochrome P450 [Streptomyces]MCL6293268.1 cytochrome P450 [Streptomyces sp. 43Y-GA-1]MCX4710509.1 cytochrome P450 [Streptomyces griseus]MDX2670062.1 cytochrome P450 [Streptomyces sp. NRRL_ISP-5395]MDX3336980.1 cytochrome P450 [Streptomyces sp. ME02-6979.5a]MDX3591470.1 cytochrome P450 [Streptomyces sp. ID03-2B]